MKNTILWGMLGIIVCTGCSTATKTASVAAPVESPAALASYYVSATGSDGNNGTTSSAAFKTLSKALEAVLTGAGSVRTITIIGVIDDNSEASENEETVFVISDTGGGTITITGADGVLSASGTVKRVLEVTGTAVVQLEHIAVSGAQNNLVGGGVSVSSPQGSAQLSLLQGAHITGNNSGGSSGGGLYVGEGGSVRLNGGSITGNTTTAWGGGVIISEGGSLTMDAGDISKNHADLSGGGVNIKTGGTFVLNGGSITGNTAVPVGGSSIFGDGGGVSVEGGSFSMQGGTISDNQSINDGGGIFIDGDMSITITGAAITGNAATSRGGGISIGWGSTVVIQNSTFTGNTAVLEGGGGIYLSDQASVTVTASAITGNTSDHWGGGILSRGAVILNNGSTVTGNTAADSGGGIAVLGDGAWTAEDSSSVAGNSAPGDADVYSEW